MRALVCDWPVVLSVLVVPLELVVSDGIDEFGVVVEFGDALVSGGGVVVLWSAGVSDEAGGMVDWLGCVSGEVDGVPCDPGDWVEGLVEGEEVDGEVVCARIAPGESMARIASWVVMVCLRFIGVSSWKALVSCLGCGNPVPRYLLEQRKSEYRCFPTRYALPAAKSFIYRVKTSILWPVSSTFRTCRMGIDLSRSRRS